MKRIILLFFLITFYISAQDSKVVGLIDNGESKFLITENGLIKTDDDAYLKYYQVIYNDSTITNPNTVVNTKQIKIIPIIDPKDWTNLNYEIAPNIYFYDFLDHDSTGTIFIKPEISRYLNNYKPPQTRFSR